ncbi:flagellar protein FlaG [Alsobacter sp. R-9]
MDVGPANRPNTTSAQPVVRPDTPAVRAGVSTEVASEAAVTAVEDSSPTRVDISRTARTLQAMEAPQGQPLRRETTRDEETSSLVYRVTNEKTGQVVQQIPDETLLRLRAAIAEQQQRRAEAEGAVVEKTA